MNKIRKITAASLTLLSLSACAQQSGYGGGYGSNYDSRPTINKQTIGTLAGGAAGAVAATNIGKGKGNIAAIAVGTLLGAAIGSEIGKSLDRADQEAMYRSSQNTFENVPTGQTTQWRNPDSGNYGTYTPTRTYMDNNGTNCREFSQTIVVGGRREEGYGTACRMSDGSWQIRS